MTRNRSTYPVRRGPSNAVAMISLPPQLGEELRSLQLECLDQPAGEWVAVFLMRLLKSWQLFLYLGQPPAQRRLRIRCSQCCVRLSFLPAGILSRFTLRCARIIGDGAADDFLESRLKWIGFASHKP
jgi:hypothetical protein